MSDIRIRGARTHNLKNFDLDIPRGKLTVITGVSGSGKSSLAFDTLYAEGQRRYVESLSTYARQFLELMGRADVDLIEGLSPSIAIEQKTTQKNPRSTVGTSTEIYDYLRLLFSRAGTPYCPEHGIALKAVPVSEIAERVLQEYDGRGILVIAPLPARAGVLPSAVLEDMQARGFMRFRIRGTVYTVDELPDLKTLDPSEPIEVVVDRIKVKADSRSRIAEAAESALHLSEGKVIISEMSSDKGVRDKEELFSDRYSCPYCGYALSDLEPKLFSFNSPAGRCEVCEGLGVTEDWDESLVVAFPDLSLASGAIQGWEPVYKYNHQLLRDLAQAEGFSLKTPWHELSEKHKKAVLYGTENEIPMHFAAPGGEELIRNMRFEGVIPITDRRWRETKSPETKSELGKWRSTITCPECRGARLNEKARNVFIEGRDGKVCIQDIVSWPLKKTRAYFANLKIEGSKAEIADRLIKEISSRLQFLIDVGLGYLTLERAADTLSGGEAQRIRLAGQIGSQLSGVMYVLDEPSIGLHPTDNDKLIGALKKLRDLGNTVIVVEHDEETIRQADFVVDMGPGPGAHGGEVIAKGAPEQIQKDPASLTGAYLSGALKVAGSSTEKAPSGHFLTVEGAAGNNLKDITVRFPVGLMSVVTGVSGSGKSTLVNKTLLAEAACVLNGAHTHPAPFKRIKGLEQFDKVIAVDQSPIGKTPRSNPATYTGVFAPIREIFAETPLARERGYGPGRFSFNAKGGRCESCEGAGLIKVEMNFLPDMYVPCDTCGGTRYNRETLEIEFKGKNIAQVLDLTVDEALEFFSAVPAIARKLRTLADVGLGYIRLGQSATTLSGGEAQRIKLALELARRGTGKTLYILDEPTTGLHFHDVDALLSVLEKIKDAGNTLVIIEHNLDVIRAADWIVELGPGGGDEGGSLVAEGIPREVSEIPSSKTARFLGDYGKSRGCLGKRKR